MSSYKKFVDDLQDKISAYKYFEEENLILLKKSVDLSIVHDELWERAIKFKGTERYDELMEFVNTVKEAKEGYDAMYTKYNYYKLVADNLHTETNKLISIVNAYQKEDNLLAREI